MIRTAYSTDIDQLAVLWSGPDTHIAGITGNPVINEPKMNYDEQVRHFIGELDNNENSAIFVYEQDKVMVGFVTAHIDSLPWFLPTTGLIGAIWVNKDFRNSGVGKQLLKRAESWLTTKNVLNIQVWWDLENGEAGNFWEYNGYAISQLRGTKSC